MSDRKQRILIVDDEKKMADAVALALARSGYSCETCCGGESALTAYRQRGADLVITDQRMPAMDGLTLMQRLKDMDPGLPVIVITAYGAISAAVTAIRQGAFDYISKPFDNAELRHTVARGLELSELQLENRSLRRQLRSRFEKELIAESPAMKTVLERIDRAAHARAPVLILGESGTGKELVARRLHYLGDRAERPFVAVNCKAFAEGVLESELFGHEKGAFSGADTSRAGCFERAGGGTLFLDEIGEVSLGFQAKILRVLQEGELLRVGGNQPLKVDVRVVSATNRDLRQRIAEGRFREDLYFRLNVIPVHLAPLRERKEDIMPLADHFLARHGLRAGKPWRFSPETTVQLLRHTWSGNIRELENAVERATVLARGPVIEPEDLLLEQSALRVAGPSSLGEGSLQECLDRAAAERIRHALVESAGKKAEAALALAIDRTTLYRLMKRLNIS